MSQEDMVTALRKAGYRLTMPRLAVLQVLQEHHEELSPEEVHRLGKAIYASLGLVTVYRTLELLNRLRLAQRIHTTGGCHGYARIGGDHHHLVCRRCARVVEFPCTGLDELIEQVCRATGFTVDTHLLELNGLCPECQKA